MNNENEIIKSILKNFRKSPLHQNEFFHSDSEIIKLGGNDYLISVDGYSDEDHFRLDNPFNLGVNLAVCTLSDIFACGGKPILFCNSINSQESWGMEYLDSLSKGISSVLEKCNTGFIGGDFGYAEKWNFSGVVIGQAKRIVSRKGAMQGDIIYLTGEIGNGNYEAAYCLNNNENKANNIFDKHPVIFPLRLKEAPLVSEYASSCIDTSDGLFKSLLILSEINNCGFQVSDIPYSSISVEYAKCAGIFKECLMFGECGEYELLFTVNPDNENKLLNAARETGCSLYRIGQITGEDNKLLETDNKKISLNDYDVFARNFPDHYEYIKCLTNYLASKLAK